MNKYGKYWKDIIVLCGKRKLKMKKEKPRSAPVSLSESATIAKKGLAVLSASRKTARTTVIAAPTARAQQSATASTTL